MLQIKITMVHYIESFGELISDKQYKFNKLMSVSKQTVLCLVHSPRDLDLQLRAIFL